MGNKLGQHFLKNNAEIKKIISALRLAPGETIIEIGAGHGELTKPLAEACRKKECAVVAVEKDLTLVRAHLGPLQKTYENLTVAEGDILKILDSLEATRGSNRYKIAGNLPYYITGNLLRRISELRHKPILSVLMIQKEVAKRIIAVPPRMNRLSASVQFWAEPAIVSFLGKEEFSPRPEVDSAIIVLRTKEEPPADQNAYYRSVRCLFAQPRKTILNNLVSGTHLAKEEVAKKLETARFDPKIRAQNLATEHIVAIANLFFGSTERTVPKR